MAPQFMNHGISDVNALNKSSGIWIPATRNISFIDANYWSVVGHFVGQGAAIRDAVINKSYYSEENYKTDFEILMEDSKLQFYHKNIERSQPPLD